ncbi:MAG TPA: class I SAM-dependent methyltransferase [Allosphingosinicella sp.]|nr:class I SAM-dependent methyltransferase [Allosphingosinicella sp.]
MEVRQLKARRLYPEIRAGGFSHVDGTIEFYQRINALLEPDMIVLDFGAGRGEQLLDESVPYRARLCRLQGKVKHLVGVDIDTAVLANPYLDEAHVVDVTRPLPFPDGHFDLIYADWVLEHVAAPADFAREVRRLLKPGGWFCARTPNRWGITGLGANLIPNRLHTRILRTVQPERQEQDVFPTAYRMNTLRSVKRYFPDREWDNCSYISNSEPPYVQRSIILMRLVQLFWRLTPGRFHTTLNLFVRRRPPA